MKELLQLLNGPTFLCQMVLKSVLWSIKKLNWSFLFPKLYLIYIRTIARALGQKFSDTLIRRLHFLFGLSFL